MATEYGKDAPNEPVGVVDIRTDHQCNGLREVMFAAQLAHLVADPAWW
jgi:hypothetical protein